MFFQLILTSVLNCLYDSISQILRKNVEKRSLMENLDVAMLALDEICDNGYYFDKAFEIILSNEAKLIVLFDCFSIILESDPTAISYRVAVRNDDIPIGEQTVAQVVRKTQDIINDT